MLSRLGKLVFIVLPVVVFALGVAVAVILALGWAIQHFIDSPAAVSAHKVPTALGKKWTHVQVGAVLRHAGTIASTK